MFLRLAILSFVAFGLLACKGTTQNAITLIDEQTGSLSAFEGYLENGYIELAQSELSEDDVRDARLFIHRARRLQRGESVAPTEVDARKFTPENRAVITQARASLMRFLDGGAKSSRPEIAARAQVMFDCWSQELEENRQPNHIELCRGSFLASINGLEGLANSNPELANSNLESDVIISNLGAADNGDDILLFFPYDVHNRTNSGKDQLVTAAKEAIANNVVFVLITANSDSSGGLKYNYDLSVKRGEHVRDLLVKQGIDVGLISVIALGEKSLPVETGDGVKDPRNRRAKVEFRY